MSDKDDVILEFLDDRGLALPPKVIHYNLETRPPQYEIPYSTLTKRLKALVKAGLLEIERETGGYYAITGKGREYLRGELDQSEIPEDVTIGD